MSLAKYNIEIIKKEIFILKERVIHFESANTDGQFDGYIEQLNQQIKKLSDEAQRLEAAMAT